MPQLEQTSLEWLVDELRDALAHLYDYAHLTEHPLGAAFVASSPGERMRRLRAAILEGIEQLQQRCGPGVAAHLRRSYEVLNRHYVQGLMVTEVAHELGISRRQAYRCLRQAELDLAVVMAEVFAPLQAETPPVTPLAGQAAAQVPDMMTQREISRATSSVASVSIAELLSAAAQGVANLAAERHVTLEIDGCSTTSLRCAVATARQAVLYALSAVTQAAAPHTTLHAGCAMVAGQAVISLHARCAPTAPDLRNARELLASISGCCQTITGNDAFEVTLHLPSQSPLTLLVIDDNPGMIELFARFLQDEDHRLWGETDPERAIARIAEVRPDVIILDVMMPHRDGWHVLQQLRSYPDTRDVPVIVCSVLDDPALAISLGASAFLAKPVTRAALLVALAEVSDPA